MGKDLGKSLHSYSQYWSDDLQRLFNENVFLVKEGAVCAMAGMRVHVARVRVRWLVGRSGLVCVFSVYM